MKKPLIQLVIVTSIILLFYICGSLGNASLNIALWSDEVRQVTFYVCIACCLFSLFISTMVLYDKSDIE
jgi:multisubunit Na+/H+ antiporter MnhB subunit